MLELEEHDIHSGALIPIYLNGKLDGYAILIEAQDEPMTYINDEDEDLGIEVSNMVRAKQRWLIQWATPDECEGLEGLDRFAQLSLGGKRTHRFIHYVAGRISWEAYANIYGPLKEKPETNKPLEDPRDTTILF